MLREGQLQHFFRKLKKNGFFTDDSIIIFILLDLSMHAFMASQNAQVFC